MVDAEKSVLLSGIMAVAVVTFLHATVRLAAGEEEREPLPSLLSLVKDDSISRECLSKHAARSVLPIKLPRSSLHCTELQTRMRELHLSCSHESGS